MALCPWKIRLFSRQPIYSPGLDITNYGKTLYKQIHAPKHLEILGSKTRARAWCHFDTNPDGDRPEQNHTIRFNQLSNHLATFWSKTCIKLQASITVSLEVVFCKFNKNLTKGFQWTALGFVCPHWISSFNFKIFKLKLGFSEFKSTSVGQSWAVQLLRIAPRTEAGSATWHQILSNYFPSLSIRCVDQQRSRCAIVAGPAIWGTGTTKYTS